MREDGAPGTGQPSVKVWGGLWGRVLGVTCVGPWAGGSAAHSQGPEGGGPSDQPSARQTIHCRADTAASGSCPDTLGADIAAYIKS